ncbi:CopG family transcriptional regulator [Halegenticoccus soli]|uniref:CopG family transcriptional regulator n=1 Tax=Halegenticoccus soli TaxID=1985678 RepID=UPI00117ACAAF|nr:CopG family transcriptional regulator [Halegenticoccus soli]
MNEEIEIPESIINKIKGRVEKTDFETVEEYVIYVLTEALSVAEKAGEDDAHLTEHDEIEDRLKTLGYLN